MTVKNRLKIAIIDNDLKFIKRLREDIGDYFHLRDYHDFGSVSEIVDFFSEKKGRFMPRLFIVGTVPDISKALFSKIIRSSKSKMLSTTPIVCITSSSTKSDEYNLLFSGADRVMARTDFKNSLAVVEEIKRWIRWYDERKDYLRLLKKVDFQEKKIKVLEEKLQDFDFEPKIDTMTFESLHEMSDENKITKMKKAE